MKLPSAAILAVSLLLVLPGADQSAALTTVPNLFGAAPNQTRFDSITAKKEKTTKKKVKKEEKKNRRCIYPWTCKKRG
jgi:hypothetical protein